VSFATRTHTSFDNESFFAMMVQSRVALFLALALMMAALPVAGLARTGEELIWTEHSSDNLTSLAYGSLDPATNPLFMLSCFNGMSIAVLDVHHEVAGTKPGEPLTIELSAGAAQSPVKGEAALDEASGVTFAEASDIAVKPVLAVLRAEGPLTVKLGETSATLSDNGRAEAVAQFSKDCLLD
jgi:hypothetical protein